MINASTEFKNALAEGRQDFEYYADITLSSEKQLNLTNKNLWSGGVKFTDAISSDNAFDIGDAIINSASLVINNISGEFDTYTFEDADVQLTIGIPGVSDSIQRGLYDVDEAKYNGSLITLNLYDHMHRFDKPYSISTLSYPATFEQIVRNACDTCGVTYGSMFDGQNVLIPERPSDENLTYRELISYIAQYLGGYARVSAKGALEIKGFPLARVNGVKDGLDGGTFANYSSGDTADGGAFKPWDTGYALDVHEFPVLTDVAIFGTTFSHDFGVDTVMVTGIHVNVKTDNETKTYTAGSDGYVLTVSDNPLITTANAQSVAERIYDQIGRYIFRAGTVSVLKNPLVEAGDPALVYDAKNRNYAILVSSLTFTSNGNMNISSSAETPTRQAAARNSELAKTYTELQTRILKEQSARETAMKSLSTALAEKSGLYESQETTSSGTIYYMHDKPELSDSKVVWKLTTDALGVSTDGGKTWNAGLQVNGDLITRILSATGINADWLITGTISDKSNKNSWNLNTGAFKLTAGSGSTIAGKPIASTGDVAIKVESDGVGRISASASRLEFNSKTCTFNAGTFVLNATNAKITADGTCTFNAGKVGGWNIDQYSIYSDETVLNPTRGIVFKNPDGKDVSGFGRTQNGNKYGSCITLYPGSDDFVIMSAQLTASSWTNLLTVSDGTYPVHVKNGASYNTICLPTGINSSTGAATGWINVTLKDGIVYNRP